MENFDHVTAPNLPANWGFSTSGGGSAWTTVTNAADSPPNSAFVSDVQLAGASELISPPIPISSASAELTFQNNYAIESDTNLLIGYDGGVLEIQIGNGPFIDILDAGGIFLSGGYNENLEPTTDNPLAGRQAWSGDSGGFITTSVRLPATAAGNTVRLKWRLGTDSAVSLSGSGWAIDSIILKDFTNNCCRAGAGAPAIISPPATQSAVPGTNVTFKVSAVGDTPLGFQWRFNDEPIAGETSPILMLTNVQAPQMGVYAVIVTNASGLTASTNAWLKILVPPAISCINLNGSGVSVGFAGLYGLSYTLQYKDSLSDPAWLAILPSVPGSGSAATLADPNPAPTNRFYRLICQ
jgi:hypothetical protein